MPTKALEPTIPPELAKAFEVKEIPPPTPAPVVEEPAKKPTKRKKTVVKKAAPKIGPVADGFAIPVRRPNPDPIRVGEKIWMDVTWLNTKAGEFLLEVLPHKEINGRKVYDFKGSAKTSDLFSIVYKAEDWVESFVDYDGWFPYKFVLHGDETKHIRNNVEFFDHAAKKQYVSVHDNLVQKNEIREEKGYRDLTPFSQDSLSALYFVRTHVLDEGAVVKFPMTTAGNQWETIVTVLAREEVSTKMGYVKAIKTKIETRFNGVLQQQGDAFMWFTDDERKVPVRFEAKVKIGWIAGIAKKIEPGEERSKDETKPGSEAAPATKSSSVRPPRYRTWFHSLIESVSGIEKKK